MPGLVGVSSERIIESPFNGVFIKNVSAVGSDICKLFSSVQEDIPIKATAAISILNVLLILIKNYKNEKHI